MVLGAHTIHPSRGSYKTKKRVGRGNSAGQGTYAGRGLKGQKARSGGKGGVKRLGFKKSLQKIPKNRGFHSLVRKGEIITLTMLERVCADGEMVTPLFLEKKGLIGTSRYGVKIVATGQLKKRITLTGCLATKTAAAAIEKAGGTVIF